MKYSKAAILLLFLNALVLNLTVFGEITEDQNVNQNSNTGKSEKKSLKSSRMVQYACKESQQFTDIFP